MEQQEPQHDRTRRGEVLLEQASELLAVLRAQARRAFVVELTGTPKAGKSTSVVALQTFFKEAGYQVHLLKERAADCPLPMKGHFFFNAWTMATMLAEVLETHETQVDLLILDRGFFDALVWLELQARRGQVTEGEKQVFSEFVLLERWRSLVDVTVLMKVDPEKALQREHQNQIVHRVGSMMNPRALGEFNDALAQVASEYSDRFSLIEIDTTSATGVVTTNIELLEALLPRIEQWSDPKIAVLPRQVVIDVFGDRPFLHGDDARPALAQLAAQVSFRKRSDAEKDKDVVQLIAAGIHAHDDRIMVLERDPRDKKAMAYGRRSLWSGCHVDVDGGDLLTGAIRCLDQRVQQELHLATHPKMDFLGLSWDKNQVESQHFGVMFRVPVVSDYVANHLKDKQFKKMGRSGRIKSLFMTQEEILRDLGELDLEPWSEHMARNIKLTRDPQPDEFTKNSVDPLQR
jgi:predicted NUDIX family phosphoesterase/predicted ATPase